MRPDRDLDRELRDLGPRVEYPPTPDLARSVRERLEAQNVTAGAPARSGPQLWWIAAAALALLVALPGLAVVLNGTGGSLSGGAAGGAAGVAEPTRSSPATESGAAPSAAGSPAGACGSPAPTLEVEPPRGGPGDAFRLRGEGFDGDLRDCDDDPARDVRVEFLQNGRTWDLGRLASDGTSRLDARLRVPDGAGTGCATVRAAYGQGPPGEPYGQQAAEARFLVTD